MRKSQLTAAALGGILILLAAPLLLSQTGRGIGRLGGVVVDQENKPLEGVKVILAFAQSDNLKLETTTNSKGEWSFIGLGTGDWNMTAVAKGYLPVNKMLYVSQLAVNPKVTVTLEKAPKGGGGFIEDEASFALLEKGNQLLKEGKHDEAMAVYQQFLEKNPAAYQVEVNIADCYQGKGEFDRAVEIYNQVIEKAKTDAVLGKEATAKALAGIGNCYLKQNNIEAAQKFFKESVDSSPKDEILAYNVGEIYFSNQKHDEALRYFQLAAEIKPEWPDPYLKMGYCYLNKADYPSAIEQFDKFLKLEPETERSALVRNILNAIKK